MKVIHRLPGRLRIELKGLYGNPKLAVLLKHNLARIAGVIKVQASCITGRLLVFHAPDRAVDIKDIQHQIQYLVQYLAQTSAANALLNTQVKNCGQNNQEHRAYELEGLPIGRQFLLTGISSLLLLQAFLKPRPTPKIHNTRMEFDFDTAITLFTGYPIFRTAIEHLLKKGRVNSELLAAAATITALATKQSRMSLFVVTLIYFNTLMRTLAGEKARDKMRRMLEGKAPTARIIMPQGYLKAPGYLVARGTHVFVQSKERIPVDGVICKGAASISQCPARGGNKLAPVVPGDPVYAGGLVVDGQLIVITDQVGEKTRIGRIMQTLKKESHTRADDSAAVVRLMHGISTMALAAAAAVYLTTLNAGRAVTILVVGSPGAAGMAMSMPLGMAVGQAAARGMLVKKSRYMARLGRVDTVLFNQNTLLEQRRDISRETIAMLEESQIAHMGLPTGSSPETTKAKHLSAGRAEDWLNCPVQQKVKIIQKLKQQNRIVAVVGDGVSDVPALAAADVGITLNQCDYLDLESAHMVIDGDDMRQVAHLVRLAQYSLQVARQNINISAGTNILGIGLGALGLLSPLTMALLQNAGTFFIMFNSGRLLFQVPSDMVRN